MRRRDDLRQLGERPVLGRLLLEHVQAGALDDAAVDGAAERGLVDELAARRVDEPQARFADGEPGVVEHVAGFGRERQVQRDVVGGRAQRVERQQLDAEPGGDFGRDIRIVRDDSHAEGPRAQRHLVADSPQARDAERLPAELVPEEALLLPAALLHRSIGGGHQARQRQHERQRVLRDADAVGPGRVDDEDAARAGGRDIDVVHAGAGAGHNPQLRRGFEQPGVDLRRAANDQRVGVGEVGRERGRGPSGARINLPARFGAQQFEGGGGEGRRQ